jgi:hypothetical protein
MSETSQPSEAFGVLAHYVAVKKKHNTICEGCQDPFCEIDELRREQVSLPNASSVQLMTSFAGRSHAKN